MKYFSLFAGIGGLEYGAHEKGFKCVGFSEIKESSIEIYKKNLGADLINYGDITTIEPKELPDFDILMGGFPCQSFSLAGLRKGFGDKRGKMIFYIYDIIKEKKPKFIILENVKGIINHEQGRTYKKVLELLTYAGYNVRVVLLNSLHYGSAQSRERVFFLGSRDFDFPVKYQEEKDTTKLFKDVREKDGKFRFIKHTEANDKKIDQSADFSFELIGDYDRVGTITTQYGGGAKLVWEKDDLRYPTPLECERLQGFPEKWTEGISEANRYFALGNAVNCNVSDYLFNDYLEKLWFNREI